MSRYFDRVVSMLVCPANLSNKPPQTIEKEKQVAVVDGLSTTVVADSATTSLSEIPQEIMLLAQGSYNSAKDNNHEQVTAEHVEAAAQLQRIEDPESIEAGAGVV